MTRPLARDARRAPRVRCVVA